VSLRIRPGRPLAPIASAPVVAVLGWLVVHDSGAGWVQVLGDLVAATLLVGFLGPAVVLARARLHVDDAPLDATAGGPVALHLEASTRLRVRPIQPPGPDCFVGPGPATSEASEVIVVPTRRALVTTVVLEVATAAPWGLQFWTRRVVLDLPATLAVAPRRGRPAPLDERPGGEAGDRPDVSAGSGIRAGSGEMRGVRPYQPGDRRSRVHWAATAHAGELLVRDDETPPESPQQVRVVLPSDPEAAEAIAETALATILALFERGSPVLLSTCEAGRITEGWVSDRRGAGRRLAAAGPPTTTAGPGALLGTGVKLAAVAGRLG